MIEVFVVAGLIYLAINFALTRLVAFAEHRFNPQLRAPLPISAELKGEAH